MLRVAAATYQKAAERAQHDGDHGRAAQLRVAAAAAEDSAEAHYRMADMEAQVSEA